MIRISKLYNDPLKDIQLGVMFSSPVNVINAGLKRECYVTISLGLIQISIGRFVK